jgi:hypothetical protein
MRRLKALTVAIVGIGLLVPDASATETDAACPPNQVPSAGFTDVADGSTHRLAIDCVVWWSVAFGTSSTTYGPNANLTREEMAAFVARAMRAAGYDLPTAPRDAFDDTAASPYKHAIHQVNAVGVVRGFGDGTYRPRATVSRAQMATYLVNLYEETTGGTLTATRDYFDDDDGTIHESNINKIAEAGITQGTAPRTYSPSLPVRRGQIGSFLARVLDRFVREDVATRPPPVEEFVDGTWRVPDEVTPGIYRTMPSDVACYWERSGHAGEIKANGLSRHAMIVEISSADAEFESERCALWSTNLSSRTKSTTTPFGPGAYLVGTEIEPGLWRSTDSSRTCYWARLSGWSGEPRHTIADGRSQDIQTVAVRPDDIGFTSDQCGSWIRIGN